MLYVCLFVLGLCLGSFVNALVWRLHQQSLPRKKRAASDAELSIAKGRSMCTHCQHTLAWYDLIPLASWLSLAGKCRYCKHSIGLQYPIVEIAAGLLFVVSYRNFPVDSYIQLVTWLLLVVSLLALFVYDLRWMILPNKLVAASCILAFMLATSRFVANPSLQTFLGPLWGVVCLAGLFYLLFQLSGGKWIGGGDVKLGATLGLVVGGPLNALAVLFLASLLGSLIGLPLIVLGKATLTKRLPFGPLLIVAMVIVFLFGASLLSWYKTHLLTI